MSERFENLEKCMPGGKHISPEGLTIFEAAMKEYVVFMAGMRQMFGPTTKHLVSEDVQPMNAGVSLVNLRSVKWKKVDEDRFNYMMGVVPPIMKADGFLVGEASTHRQCRVKADRDFCPDFAAFKNLGEGAYYECMESLTRYEFDQISHDDVLANVVEDIPA